MKIGLIARADNSGLGNQTFEFYRHMKPAKTMVVDISGLNGNKQYYERYPGAQIIQGFPNKGDIHEFLLGLDVVFVAEAPYNYWLYEHARELGVKTAVQYNYEFFDWFKYPENPKPDMLIAPSKWHYEDVQKWCDDNNIKHAYLHCPVNRDLLPFRKIKKARTFLHVAGRAAAFDRNGTEIVIQASKYLKTKAFIIVHFQGEQGLAHQATRTFDEYFDYLNEHGGNNITLQQQEYDNYEDVYKDGDVLIMPRRYGGNCLALNEALSVGMPAIMTNISPNDSFLPATWLIPAQKIGQFEPRTVIDIYGSDPKLLAAKIDEFYNMNENEMTFNSGLANTLAEKISWEIMKPLYEEALKGLCKK